MGLDNEFISSTRLDNLSLLHAALRAMAESDACRQTTVLCCVDNEEVGNRTRQGADSPMLATVLERIVLAAGGERSDYLRSLDSSFMISADVSHALHPNVPDRTDPVIGAKLNCGPTIKFSGAQKFTSDSNSISVFKQLCADAGVPFQYYVNRSDSPGGSSAGPASVSQTPMRSVDIGIPVFAMHSIRELCGVKDNEYVRRAFAKLYT
jgi:aspartyl aminopeptidase